MLKFLIEHYKIATCDLWACGIVLLLKYRRIAEKSISKLKNGIKIENEAMHRMVFSAMDHDSS